MLSRLRVARPALVALSRVCCGDAEWRPTPRTSDGAGWRACAALSKVRLSALVVVTAGAGYAAAPAPFEPLSLALCCAGTALVSSAANALNQFFEVPFDAQMSRTRSRPLVTGALLPAHAAGFALCAFAGGAAVLYAGVNALTALLGAANLVLYSCVYTPMKRTSVLNTWVGSAVGAVPPLMGWAACQGELGAGAFLLAALLYSWQFPHFNALSWNLRPDYSRAGYRMMAVTDPALCRRVALRHTLALTAMCCSAPHLGVTGDWFAATSLPLNLYFVYLAWRFYKNADSQSSRKLFRFSLVYLPALMALFLAHKKSWASAKPEGKRGDAPKSFTVTLPAGAVVNAQSCDT